MAKETSPVYKFQYAAKFICTSNIPNTSQTTDSFVPGSYKTAVNIHNPQPRAVRLRKKLASPIGISAFQQSSIEPDGAELVSCGQVNSFGLHLVHGFEGFLVIESTLSIDVVAVYTANPQGSGVSAMDVEQIRERKL